MLARRLGLACLAAFFLLRWLPADSAFPGEESDYGSHIAIINWLATRPRWPPLYSGILGAHSIAALLHVVGMTIPKAMLVTADIAICLFLLALVRVAMPIGRMQLAAGLVTTALVSVPLLGTMLRDGFFGPVVANGFYAMGIARLLPCVEPPPRPALRDALLWFGAATITYPDGFLWCVPLLLILSFRSIPLPSWLLAAALVIAIEYLMLSRLLGIVAQEGGGNLAWDKPMLIGLLLATLFFASDEASDSHQRFRVLLSLYIGIVTLACTYSIYQAGVIGYYPRKLLYSFVLFAPLLAIHTCRTVVSGLVFTAGLTALVWFLPVTIREDIPTSYRRLLRPVSDFDGSDEQCVLATHTQAEHLSCKHLVVLPGAQRQEPDSWGQRILRVMAANSYTREYDPNAAQLLAFNTALASSFGLADLLRSDPHAALGQVLSATQNNIDCFAVGPELLPRARSTSKQCLTILRAAEMPKEAALSGTEVDGFVDHASCEQLDGWALAPAYPHQRVILEILVDSEVVGSTRANLPRPDLLSNKLGDGQYGFAVALPTRAKDGREHEVSLRVAGAEMLLAPGAKRVTCPTVPPGGAK